MLQMRPNNRFLPNSGTRSARQRFLIQGISGLWLCVLLSLVLTCGGRAHDASDDPDDQDGGAGANGNAGDNDDGTGGRQLLALSIKPDNDILLVDQNVEATKQFNVRAIFADGGSTDLSRKVTWSLSEPDLGNFQGSVFHSAVSSTNKVGFTKVYARLPGHKVSGTANLSIVWLRQSGPSQDFFFALPYQTEAQKKPLTFTTRVQSLDVFFAVDTTGSMSGEIVNLTSDLQTKIIPDVKEAAGNKDDAWFGVGAIDDWPTGFYGSPNCRGGGVGMDDQPFILVQEMTEDVTQTFKGLQALMVGGSTRGCGSDTPEGQMEALYQIATGEGQMGANAHIPPNHAGIGGVKFRDGALPIVLAVSDASFHSVGDATPLVCGSSVAYGSDVAPFAHTRTQVADELNKICAKVVGLSAEVSSAGCIATQDLTYFANATGAKVPPEAWDTHGRPANCPQGKCCTGMNGKAEEPDENGLCPLVYKISSSGLGIGQAVSSGIADLARFASFDVLTDVTGTGVDESGDMLPAGKTSADFIKSIIPLNGLPPTPPPFIPTPVINNQGGFSNVYPGSLVRFMIEARNDLKEETPWPQVFHATIRVRAGGCANLDARDVIILIPPKAPTPE